MKNLHALHALEVFSLCLPEHLKLLRMFAILAHLGTGTRQKKVIAQNRLMKFLKYYLVTSLPLCLATLAITCKQHECIEDRIERVTKLIEENPNDTSNYFVRARLYGSIRDDWSAINDYSKIIQSDSTSKDAYFSQGMIFFYKGYHDKAIKNFSKVITIDSMFTTAYFWRAQSYARLWNLEAAVKDWSYCIKSIPDEEAPFRLRGEDYRILGKYENAVEDFKRVKELNEKEGDSSFVRLYFDPTDLCQLLSLLGKHDEAFDYVNKAIASDKRRATSEKWLYYRGICNYRLGRYEAAVKDLQLSIREDDYYGIPHYYLSEISAAMGQKQNARKYFTLAIEHDFHDLDLVIANTAFKKLGLLAELKQIAATHPVKKEFLGKYDTLKKYLSRDTVVSQDQEHSLLFYRIHQICMEPAKQQEVRKLLRLERESYY